MSILQKLSLGGSNSPFELNGSKKLRILVDRASFDESDKALQVLLEFAEIPQLELISTSSTDGLRWLQFDQSAATSAALPVTIHDGTKLVSRPSDFDQLPQAGSAG